MHEEQTRFHLGALGDHVFVRTRWEPRGVIKLCVFERLETILTIKWGLEAFTRSSGKTEVRYFHGKNPYLALPGLCLVLTSDLKEDNLEAKLRVGMCETSRFHLWFQQIMCYSWIKVMLLF